MSDGSTDHASSVLRVLVAGGSGFLGTHLRAELDRRGHDVTSLVRRAPSSDDEARWDPDAGEVPDDVVAASDVVVNLAGSPTLGNVHSKAWARELHDSRVRTTELLAASIARAAQGGSTPAFLAGNGISYYGEHGEAVLTEDADTRGHALLTQTARDWQEATRAAEQAGSRVCILRTAPVMDRRSPPLKQLRLLFLTGGGARLGSGRQYMPMISLRDWVGGVAHLAEHTTASGPFNLSVPQAPTNAEFTHALASAVHRPAFLAVPAALIRIGAGPMSPDLLDSVNARPAALIDAGYEFDDVDVEAVLATGLTG